MAARLLMAAIPGLPPPIYITFVVALLAGIAFAIVPERPALAQQSLPRISITCPDRVPAVSHNTDGIGTVECTFTASAAPTESISVNYDVRGGGSRGLQYVESVNVNAAVTKVTVDYLLDSTAITVRLVPGDGYSLGNPDDASIAVGYPPQTGAGLKVNESGALDGYLLLTGTWHDRFYLIDNQGREAYRWNRAGNLGKLLDSGKLLTLAQWANIGEINSDSTVAWEQTNKTEHHDVVKLSNGNYLFVNSAFYSNAQSIAAGANPACLGDNGLEIDEVVEVQPSGTSGGTVVWKWSIWDHLIQDFDASKDNYGVVADHPERIDINYGLCRLKVASNAFIKDPHHHTHMNSIDYNADLDQILITTRHFSEAWVIDHSTTTAQAASSSGGNSGMGGGLLYRWGNPRAYKNGTKSDQKVFFPHNAHWIPSGLPGEGNILIYNNGHEHPGFLRDYATVDEVVFPASGYKYLKAVGAYMPPTRVWAYRLAQRTWILSNAQRLPNGNTLITEGFFGRISEVTQSGNVVWLYVSPLSEGTSVLAENASPANPNHVWVYRAYKYATDHPGIQALTLKPESERTLLARTNQAPTVASAIADATIVNETGTHQVSLSGVFSDADNDSLTITAASSNTGVATVLVATDYSNLTVTAKSRGTATITVTADDGNGGTVSDTFTVRVKAAPLLSGATTTEMIRLAPGTTQEFSLSGVFTDPDGDALTITAESSKSAVATVTVAADYSKLTLAGVAQGLTAVTVTAEDTDGNTVSDHFSVTVGSPPNNAPTVVSAIADATIVNESGTYQVSLTGVFEDIDGDALTFPAASSNEAVTTVSVASDGFTLTVTARSRGMATVTVTADDGNGGSVDDTFAVTVKAAPTVASAIGDVSRLQEGDSQDVSLSRVFRDADGDSLTITAASSNEAVTMVSVASDNSTLTLDGVAEGTATITVTARDSDGNTVSDAFDVSVEPQGDAPAVANLRCTFRTNIVAFQWDVPQWSGGKTASYDYHLTMPDGSEQTGQLPRSAPLVFRPGIYQTGDAAHFRITANFETPGGSTVSGPEATLTCNVGDAP